MYKLWIVLDHVFFILDIESKMNLPYTPQMSVTYQPKKKKRRATHGFLARTSTANGKNVLKRRMQRGRKRLAV